ncbi:helix-hairpin-helix domain-containing protein [Zobellia nedashkovskayae]|uniref:helix-hairpin-helix domain-containing protein n=1 Tax=Zobellia nedashkovskayae TaxID=2779510 RepID=UPI001D057C06|nr:helix-hairpin-helix domain-containing protein [Zobellia nedashkovskayae]
MALVKKTKGKSSHALVTFKVAKTEAPSASDVLLLGDFNNWQTNDSSYQMDKKNGSYSKTIELEIGKSYEFRYLSTDKGWFNDHDADAYVPSPYDGVDNSVVDLSSMPEQKKKPVKKTVKKVAKAPVKKVVKKPVAKKPVVKKPVSKAKKDDLKKIEGIGPKIASILTEKGIGTFEKLSKTTVKVLEGILKEAGPRYTMHKPGSWPKQAKLASADKWDELKKLQDKLDGGK